MRSFAKLPDRNAAQPDVPLAWRTTPPQKILVHPIRSMMGDGGGAGASAPNHTAMTRAHSASNAPTPVLSPPVIRARPLRISGSAKQIVLRRRTDAVPPALQPQLAPERTVSFQAIFPTNEGEAGKLKTGAKRLKRSRSPYTRGDRRASLPSDQDLHESHVAKQYDEKAPELDSAFSFPQAVYPKPARRSSGGAARLLGEHTLSPVALGPANGLQHQQSMRSPSISGSLRLEPMFNPPAGPAHSTLKRERRFPANIDRPFAPTMTTIESKGTQATLHSRSLREPREPEPEPFNMRALVRELQVPGSAGSADSGTSSLGLGPTATFTFRAMPRRCRSSEPTIGSAEAEVWTLPDIRPARVPGVMKRRSRSGGTSCNFSRMIRSSTESIDSLGSALELQRPSTGRRWSTPGHGRRHRPVSAPSRPRHVVPDQVIERPTTGEFAESEFVFHRSAAFDFSQMSRPYSNESHTRSDVGSSIQGSIEGSRPSTAADEESLVDFASMEA